MNTIQMKDVLPALTPGEAIGHNNLTLVPLWGEGHQRRYQEYMLASEAIDAGVMAITEASDSDVVSEVLAVTHTRRLILLINGEELLGATQNSILTSSILLPPKAEIRIPVSCIEDETYDSASPFLRSGSNIHGSGCTSRDIQHIRRMCERRDSGQKAALAIASQHDICEDSSSAADLDDGIAALWDVFELYHEALPCPADACGVVAAVAGRFIVMDVFDSPLTLHVMWPRLLSSYAKDAETATDQSGRRFTPQKAQQIITYVGEQFCQTSPALGLGQDIRLETAHVTCQGLRVKEMLLHLSIFPKPCSDLADGNSILGICPPSQRRRASGA